jgi:acetyl esterase
MMMQQTDYQRLIDDSTWAFIRATGAFYPPETASLSIDDQRRVYDTMCTHFDAGRPTGVAVHDLAVAGVPCRRYGGVGPVVIYLHGGGFVVGGLHSHDDICAEICAATGRAVLAVDYRLCPEHPHPAAFDDCLAVAQATPGPILLVGDSAGGTLSAAVVAALRDPRVLGQVLIYPSLGGQGDSLARHADAPMLTAADVHAYAALRGATADDPTAAPLQADDFTGLPPTLAIAAECDPLADDALAYATRIIAAGGVAQARVEAGLVHGYLRARHSVPRARFSFDAILAAISDMAAGRWPRPD